MASFLEILKAEFESAASECEDRMDEIMDRIPAEWDVDMEDLSDLAGYVFSQDWKELTWSNFLRIIKDTKGIWSSQ